MIYRIAPLALLIVMITSFGTEKNAKTLSIAFYNVENLFDTLNDPHTNDNEFLPQSAKAWTSQRYKKKLLNTSRVIMAINDWQGPDILGVCEVENRGVMVDLLEQTALKEKGYVIIHRNSPDPRGIDVALMYKPKAVELLSYQYIPLTRDGQVLRTREVLLSSFLYRKDTLHVLVNHWSSRRGGTKQSEHKRINASRVVNEVLDSLEGISKHPKIIAMGDFNDDPENLSLQNLEAAGLLNVSKRPSGAIGGSLKYQGKWNMFDQILLSSGLTDDCRKNCLVNDSFSVLNKEWLLTEDERYAGDEPKRSFKGKKYIGGYSDHLPVSIQLHK